jgi:glycosyltransferase involved in cell wall biosynthesis
MKKIALISHTADLHGAERMLINLALLLQDSGSFSPVLLIPGEGELVDLARKLHINCVIVPKSPWYIFGKTPYYFSDVKIAAESLRRVFVNLMVDVVIINTLTSIAPMLAAIQINLPALVWLHGVIDSSMVGFRDSQFVYWNEEFLLHSACGLIANSQWTANFFTNILNAPKIDVIPNWTEIDPALPVDEEKYKSRKIVLLGTFEKNKGHILLVEAAKTLKQRGVLFEIDLYGGGLDRQHIERLCNEYGINEQVHFKGVTGDIKSAYSNAAVVVSTSFVESFGMTLIEAMASRTAVVSTRSGGPQEIIQDGETGYMVERSDSRQLADRLEKIISDPALARQMGDKGYQVVCDKYSSAQAFEAFSKILIEMPKTNRYSQGAINFAAFFTWLGENFLQLILSQPHSPNQMHLNIAKSSPMELGGYFDPVKVQLIYSMKINRDDLSGIVFNQYPFVLPSNIKTQVEITTISGKSLRKVELTLNETKTPAQIGFTKICNVNQRTLLLKMQLPRDHENGRIAWVKQWMILTASTILKRKLGRTVLNISLQ